MYTKFAKGIYGWSLYALGIANGQRKHREAHFEVQNLLRMAFLCSGLDVNGLRVKACLIFETFASDTRARYMEVKGGIIAYEHTSHPSNIKTCG
jgi:hypothetical protein